MINICSTSVRQGRTNAKQCPQFPCLSSYPKGFDDLAISSIPERSRRMNGYSASVQFRWKLLTKATTVGHCPREHDTAILLKLSKFRFAKCPSGKLPGNAMYDTLRATMQASWEINLLNKIYQHRNYIIGLSRASRQNISFSMFCRIKVRIALKSKSSHPACQTSFITQAVFQL